MISVKIYVEGPSDKAAMTELLRPLIEHKAQQGVNIQFFEAPPGDKKESLMRKVPQRAALILANEPNTIVLVVPDLHPFNKAIPHETPEQLYAVIQKEIVKQIFEAHKTHYIETADAPFILGLSDYRQISEVCPQCFKPFVEFLESLS